RAHGRAGDRPALARGAAGRARGSRARFGDRRCRSACARARMKSFDRVANEYGETRGGMERGRRLAALISPWLIPESTVLEIGVGTGVIALGLAEHGFPIFGIDVSPKMLERARERIGERVAVAD